MLGGYVFDAVSLAIGNAFRKKNEKASMYFEVVNEPLLQRSNENDATEEDKKKQTELLFKNLEIMAANYRLNHGK